MEAPAQRDRKKHSERRTKGAGKECGASLAGKKRLRLPSSSLLPPTNLDFQLSYILGVAFSAICVLTCTSEPRSSILIEPELVASALLPTEASDELEVRRNAASSTAIN